MVRGPGLPLGGFLLPRRTPSGSSVDAQLERAGYPESIDLNQIIWNLFPVIDKHPEVSVSTVSLAIDDRSIFDWLASEYGIPKPTHEARFIDYLQRANNVNDYDVATSGLLRVMTHCVEALQQIAGAYGEAL